MAIYEPINRRLVNVRRLAVLISVILLTFAALIIRLDYVHTTRFVEPAVRSDAVDYVVYSSNILHYGVFSRSYSPNKPPDPDCYRTPGYPLFLALIVRLGGPTHLYSNVLFVQAVMGALMVPLTFLAASSFMPFLPALFSALLVCASPHLISIGGYVLTESLFGFLLLISLCFYLFACRRGGTWRWVCAGFLFGIANLVTPTVLPLPWFLAGLTFLVFRRMGKDVRKSLAIFLLVFSIIPVGYAVRNHMNVSPENRDGRALGNVSIGSYPDFLFKEKRYQYYPYREDPEYTEYSSSLKNFTSIFSRRFQAEPGKYLAWYLYGKPSAFWNWNIFQGQGDVFIYPVIFSLFDVSPVARLVHDIMKWCHPFILMFALMGAGVHLYFLLKRDVVDKTGVVSMMMFGVISYYTLIFFVFAPWPRYSVPLRPELYMCASWALYLIFGEFRRKFKSN